MSDSTPASNSLFSKHRLEALSDGVFAVVMTLLVLELKPDLPPRSDHAAVALALHELARPLAGYAFAFAITGVFWTLHHRKFSLLRQTDGPHTVLTLTFLFAVTLLPLSVSIYLKTKTVGLAQAVFFGNSAFIALTLLASWLYAKRRGLADSATVPDVAAQLTRGMAAMGAAGLISCVAALVGQQWLFLLIVPVMLWARRRRASAPPAAS